MKILQVIPRFVFGGAETMCQNLSIQLKKMGHNVVIVSLYDYRSEICDKLIKNGIEIFFLNKRVGFDYKTIKQLRRIIKQFQPDVIHSHLHAINYVVFSDLFLHHRKIHTLHSIAQKESTKIGKILNHFFFKFNHVIPVALSNENKKTIINVYKINENRIPVILNGVPLSNCIIKDDYSFNNGVINIIHVGSLTPVKNHKEMIKAIKKIHDIDSRVRILFVGDGVLRDELEMFVKQLDADKYITFYGLCDDVYSLLKSADVFILPSKYEGIPMSIIEAMGSALPIVASKVGGIPDMINDGEDGLLCEPLEDSISEKIISYINSENIRQKCGSNALKKSLLFSSENMASKYIDVYRGRDYE